MNPETLGEDTDPDLELDYVDISNVDSLGNIVEPAVMRFAEAPSRARRVVGDGDTIISTVRTYLKAIAYMQRPPAGRVVSTGFAVLRPGRGVCPRFLWRLVQSARFVDAVVSHSDGVGYPAITPTRLGSLPVWLAPLPEQQAIAAFLDSETGRIDSLIAKKQRLIELLEEKRSALISHAVTRGLDPSVPLKDSGVEWLGLVPEHWEMKRLRRISPRLGVGVVVNPSGYVADEGLPFLYGADIAEGMIRADQARRISSKDSALLRDSRLNPGDLVTVRVGAPGVTAVVPPELEGANCASVMIIRRHRSFEPDWLCYCMNSRLVRYQIEVVQYGAAQKQFNISHAVDFVLPVPPPAEQGALADYLSEQTARIVALTAKVREAIERLQEYRSALISAAVTGQIDVRGEGEETELGEPPE